MTSVIATKMLFKHLNFILIVEKKIIVGKPFQVPIGNRVCPLNNIA